MRAFFHSGEVLRETRLRAAQRLADAAANLFFSNLAPKSVRPSDKWGYVEIGLGPFWIFFAAPRTRSVTYRPPATTRSGYCVRAARVARVTSSHSTAAILVAGRLRPAPIEWSGGDVSLGMGAVPA